MEISIIKKSGLLEPFRSEKIKRAIYLAGDRIGHIPSETEMQNLVTEIKECIPYEQVSVLEMHKIVCRVLKKDFPDIAESYQNWRDYKMKFGKDLNDLMTESKNTLKYGDRENANFDSALISTKGSLIRGYLTKLLYTKYYLRKRESEAIRLGTIYIHDLRDMVMQNVNCCLFDIGNVLKGGFEMANIHYTEPNSVFSALQVTGDVTLSASAQQFGGFTLPEIDKAMIPYCKKTLNHARQEYDNFCSSGNTEEREKFAWHRLEREIEQGVQAIELKLNTVPSSRGDFAFTTFTFGCVDGGTAEEQKIQRLFAETILRVRKNGHGGVPVVFPKLVYLYSQKQHDESADQRYLFQKAIECSAVAMYPDYLSIDSDFGSVSKTYREHGVVTSPMGCRAYLTPWADPETGEYVTIGRCNIGAVSLNLPLIWKIAEYEHPEAIEDNFYELLDENLEMIRSFLKRRYEIIADTPCSTNPLAFTQGGFYKGNKQPEEKIGDLIDSMTASFGITALNELTEYACGRSIYKDKGVFAKEVVKHIYNKVQKYKKEDNHLYALYGTPAESLVGTQANQIRKYLNDIGDHDGAYKVPEFLTNSFHCHVSEDITQFEKQDAEFDLFHMIEGGHIQYVRIDNPSNLDAIKAVVERGMKLGFYQGVNFDSMFCNHCGERSAPKGGKIMTCPHCGSHDVTVISRVCGYLGYSNVNGSSRMNDAKLAEIRERRSM